MNEQIRPFLGMRLCSCMVQSTENAIILYEILLCTCGVLYKVPPCKFVLHPVPCNPVISFPSREEPRYWRPAKSRPLEYRAFSVP